MKRRPQTQSKHNISTIMTKLNSAGRKNLDELRTIIEVLLDMPVSNAVIIQRGLRLYLDEFREQISIAKQHGENGLVVITNWVASERLNLIQAAVGTNIRTTNTEPPIKLEQEDRKGGIGATL